MVCWWLGPAFCLVVFFVSSKLGWRILPLRAWGRSRGRQGAGEAGEGDAHS
eukprot:gene3208-3356_t